MARQMSLDRIMIGFNGVVTPTRQTSRSRPLLRDCGIGWLQKSAAEAARRRITELSRDRVA